MYLEYNRTVDMTYTEVRQAFQFDQCCMYDVVVIPAGVDIVTIYQHK